MTWPTCRQMTWNLIALVEEQKKTTTLEWLSEVRADEHTAYSSAGGAAGTETTTSHAASGSDPQKRSR